jgi:hypothetical protein
VEFTAATAINEQHTGAWMPWLGKASGAESARAERRWPAK